MNYKLTIAYEGTRYQGWEHQPGRPTVQGKLEEVLEKFQGAPAEVIGAGRTDAGVHARAMVANVHLDTACSPEELKAYMNRYLPEDISVNACSIAADGFHARYKAIGKCYAYHCWYGDRKPVFDRRTLWVLEKQPDLEAMREAAAYLLGEQDFRSFCGNPKFKKSTVRRLTAIEISQSKERITLSFEGSGFLQNMVRILTGTLLEVGWGKRRPEDIPAILAARDRSAAGVTAPPQGLTLMRVDY